MARLMLAGLLAAAALWGCAASRPDPEPAPAAPSVNAVPSQARYRCNDGVEFIVRFIDDSAVIDAGPSGTEVLLRDAGGITPQQTVYSNPRLRSEFGLGAAGRDAVLHYLSPPLVAHCVRD